MDKNLGTDTRAVFREVLSAKRKWRNIGIALGLSYQTLQDINENHKDRTDMCLFATLSAWLHGKDKAGDKGTTWRSLIRVLRSKNVDESDLADRLATQKGSTMRRITKPVTTQPQPNLELSTEKLGVEDLPKLMTKLYPVAANWELFAVQIGIPKYEVDVISASIGPVPSKASKCLNQAISWWLANDPCPSCKKIAEVLRGNVVHHRDLANSFEAECQGGIAGRQEVYETTRSISSQKEEMSLQSEAVHVTVAPMLEKYLRSLYSRRSSHTKEEWPPTFDVEYINLVLVQQHRLPAPKRQAKETISFTIKGHIHQVGGSRLNLEDIVSYEANRKVIVVTGAPGVGKTTLALKLSREWALDNFLTEFWMLLYIPLREPIVRLAESLEDLLKYYGKSCNESDIEKIKQKQGNGVLLILDGWDELRQSCRDDDQFFPQLIRGEVPRLTECSVMVTSRPGAIENIRRHANRLIEILGFTEDQVKQYIHSYFKEEDVSARLLKDLEDYPNVASTCYIAVNLAIVCYVYYASSYSLPPTLTEVYESFVLHTLLRHFHKWEERIPSVDSVEDFKEPVKRTLRQLGELALSGLKNDDLSFSRRDLFTKCHVDETEPHFDGFGLLKPVPISLRARIETFYHFLHLTVQEFVAAYFVIRMEEKEKSMFLATNFSNVRYQTVIKFLCGMDQFKKSVALRSFVKSATPKFKGAFGMFLFECIYEGQWDEHCKEVAVHNSNRFCFTCEHFDPHQWQVVSYMMAKSGALWHFQCNGCHLGERELKCLCRFLETATKSLNIFHLSQTLIDDQGIIYMAKILQSQVALSELVLTESNLSDNAFLTLCSALEDHQCIRSLTIRDNSISRCNTVDALSRLVMKLPALQILKLNIKNFSCHDYDVTINAARSVNSSMEVVTPVWNVQQ